MIVYSKYIMGQVRIGKIAYNGDRTSQLLIFKNEIVTNYLDGRKVGHFLIAIQKFFKLIINQS